MLFFSIHNIFKFSLEGEVLPKLEGFFNKELGYFKCEKMPVDLEIELVPEIPNPNIILFPNYGKDESYFYLRDSCSNKAKFFSTSKITAESKIDGFWLLKDVIEPLMLLNMLPKGYTFLHASSVENNGEGMIFSALPETGKTQTLFDYLNREYSFLSNELTIISDKGMVYPYPRPISFYPYNLKKNSDLLDIVAGNPIKKLKIKLLCLLYKIQDIYCFKYPKSLFSRVAKIILRKLAFQHFTLEIKNDKIGKPAKIKEVHLLFKDNKYNFARSESLKGKRLFASRLWANILGEENNFFGKTVLICKVACPEIKILAGNENQMAEEIIYNALKDVDCFEVMLSNQ